MNASNQTEDATNVSAPQNRNHRIFPLFAVLGVWGAFSTAVSAQTPYSTTGFRPQPLAWSGSSFTPRPLVSSFGQSSGFGSSQPQFLGRLSTNSYASDSISNPYSPNGNSFSSPSVNNSFGRYGSPLSPYSATNPYATQAPRIYGADGTYLGKMTANSLDPDSISNPFGRYGNQYNANCVNNPYGRYGSPHSTFSANNPYSTNAPRVFGE